MVTCRMPMTKTACGLFLFLGVCVGQSFTINTVAGGGNPSTGNGDGGQAASASLTPLGLTFDSAGNMYIADGNAIRKVSTAGTITTVAGGGSCCALGDGALATNANLAAPSGIAVDASGNMYIADTGNGRLRKVSANGIISTYAGGGSQVLTSPNTIQATFAILNR